MFMIGDSRARTGFLLVLLACTVSGQNPIAVGGGDGSMRAGPTQSLLSFDLTQIDTWMTDQQPGHRQPRERTPDGISQLDLKAPGQARQEYEKGLVFLRRRSFNEAAEHLAKSAAAYPKFVAAHNALGSAYLELGQNERARGEFAEAVLLDDHLPKSYFNLGRSQLALKEYPAAEQSMQKASSIAPLNLPLLTALTYAQFLNHDYAGVISTARQVHERKHQGAALVHYLAAAAWQGVGNLEQTQRELQTLLEEEPDSPAAGEARQAIATIKAQQDQPPASEVTVSFAPSLEVASPPPGELSPAAQKILQELREQHQVAEAECEACDRVTSPGPAGPMLSPSARPEPRSFVHEETGWTLRSTVDEVAVFFAATDHGKSVTGLAAGDIRIRDDGNDPTAITGFRNESQLPLRVGLLIDTSSSVARRFSFEQGAATDFLQKVITDENDRGFVVGFASAVLLAQDFTDDKKQIARAVGQLAPDGGTAIWDAVSFAADKLVHHPESRPVARILVVISDGDDNSSDATLKEAIERAEQGGVMVYAVSTRQADDHDDLASSGNHALKVMAKQTGGAALFPGSRGNLKRSLAELQEVIRSRYLISYKPARFKPDGKYRSIEIAANKSGQKLRVYARKGYFAHADTLALGKF
jgi:Ca-activated chloride channel homolog